MTATDAPPKALPNTKRAPLARRRALAPAKPEKPVRTRRRRSAAVAPAPVLTVDEAMAPVAARPRRRLGYTGTLSLLAVLFWAGLAGVIYFVDPDRPAGRVAFFVAFVGALFCSVSPILRAISVQCSRSRVYHEVAGWHAMRQAGLLTIFVTLNALLQMERAWSALTALLLFSVFAVIEIVALARR